MVRSSRGQRDNNSAYSSITFSHLDPARMTDAGYDPKKSPLLNEIEVCPYQVKKVEKILLRLLRNIGGIFNVINNLE